MECKVKNNISMKLKYEIGQCSDIGLVRSSNEDSLLSLNLGHNMVSDTNVSLYAVADGLGGYQGGEIASKIALKVLAENISNFILSTSSKKELNSQEAILNALTAGIKAANNEVSSQSQVYANNMATTLVAMLVIDDSAYISNVGDSRAYCLDGEHLRQITIDHSLVADLVSEGEISPEDMYTHPQRNIVTRWIGSDPNMKVDLFTERLKPGTSLILCSDGLWEMVRDNQIEKIAREQSTAQEACEQLVDMAKQNGGLDNISVIIIKVTG